MDKYTKSIRYLTKHPDKIHEKWNTAIIYPNEIGCCLFKLCGDVTCGCLTQVKHDDFSAQIPELTEAIRADNRIPKMNEITVKDLNLFAQWQRKIEKILKKK